MEGWQPALCRKIHLLNSPPFITVIFISANQESVQSNAQHGAVPAGERPFQCLLAREGAKKKN
jgi:hypothetical protein